MLLNLQIKMKEICNVTLYGTYAKRCQWRCEASQLRIIAEPFNFAGSGSSSNIIVQVSFRSTIFNQC